MATDEIFFDCYEKFQETFSNVEVSKLKVFKTPLQTSMHARYNEKEFLCSDSKFHISHNDIFSIYAQLEHTYIIRKTTS